MRPARPAALDFGDRLDDERESASDDAAPVADALDRLADGYYEMDFGFRYRRINPAGLRIAQKSRSEIIGRAVLDVFPDVANAAVHQATERVMATRQAEFVETWYPPHNRWYVNSIYPTDTGLAIFSRDITEQKLLEQNLAFLAEASKVLSSSLDYQQTLGTVATLAVPKIADWCAIDMLTAPGIVELLAVAHVDPDKVRWARELREQDPIDLDRPTGLAKVLRTGEPEFYPEITDELLVQTSRDERALALARSVGFSSAMVVPLTVREAPIGAITFVAAESGRHYTNADLNMALELANRAALAIENSRLYGESQRAVALRNDFISVASHELKTPVTSLKVYTGVLQRQAAVRGDESASRSLERMSGQIDRLAALIDDLLDVSRIEAGRLELRREPVDLDALVREAVDAIQATAERHHVEVEGSAAGPVVGDRDRLGQVVTNLLTNAVKYSPKADRVVVRIAGDGDEAAIEVEDFGIGIAPEHLGRLFDRFYRVSSDDERTFPGLGMGLYISNEIVRRHSGEMRVRSSKGAGSVFGFTIPRGDRAEATRPPEEPA